MTRRVNLPQCELIMVFIIEDVHEISVEGMDVLEIGNFWDNSQKVMESN